MNTNDAAKRRSRAMLLTLLLVAAMLAGDPVPAGAAQGKTQRELLNPEQHSPRRVPLERLLITGVFNGPEEAEELMDLRYADPYGRRYTDIWPASPDGNPWVDVPRAILANLGFPIHGTPREFYDVEQLDLHSYGVDTGLNLLRLGNIKAKKINLYAPPGGDSSFYNDAAKVQEAARGASEVNIYVNGGDLVPSFNLLGLTPQLSSLPSGHGGGLSVKQYGGQGGPPGPPVTRWIFHTEPGTDSTDFRDGFKNRHIYSAPRSGHTRQDYWFNVLAAGRRREIAPAHFQPVYWVATGEGVETLTDSGWVVLAESDDWRLVGRNRESALEYAAVLLTSAADPPERVATKLRERNAAEHPGKRAMILLDGSAGTQRNEQIIAALEQEGYARSDINVITDGDRYSADGELLESGVRLLEDTQPVSSVLAMGIWAHELRRRDRRPVIADSLRPEPGPKRRGGPARGARQAGASSREEDEDEREADRQEEGAAERSGVYTVDDRNLCLVPAEEAGTGFIFGAAETDGPPPGRVVCLPFSLFPHQPPSGADQ